MKHIRLQIIHFIAVCSFLFLVFSINSCKNPGRDNSKPVISVSILPQKYFVQKIARDNFDINVLIPPGASPASYDPTPGQLTQLADSEIYFKIGHIEFEKNWINMFANEYPDLKIIDTSVGLELMSNESSHDHGHDHGWIEPHVWMSPRNVKIIAQNIYQALIKIDEENETYYENNYKIFISELEAIDKTIISSFKEINYRKFIIYHPALTYFATDYGLEQIPIELEGKNPSPLHIKQITDLAINENIKAILVQEQFDKTKAETISKEINGQVIMIDPLDYNWPNQVLEISQKLSQALKQ